MDKKNLIIIIIVFLVVAAFGFGIYFLLRGGGQSQPSATSNNSSSYILSINKNTTGISASMTYGGKTTQLDENTLNQYASVGLNSTSDILWFECPEGYTYSNPYSTTGNQITRVPSLPEMNINILAEKQNNLTVTCDKNQ
jgi:hypothetical protein